MERIYFIELFEKFLNKEASPQEVQTLVMWLKAEGLFQGWLDEEWNMASPDMDMTLQRRLFTQIKQEIAQEEKAQLPVKKKRFHKLYLYTVRIASIVILLLLTGFTVYYYARHEFQMPDMIVSVEKGQKANIVLPDGSKVWINSDSELSYGSRFNHKERVLSLNGEAYFEVAPDRIRPFVVETDELAVRALGTSFNVKSYQEENYVSTILMTGKVAVTAKEHSVILNPNERIIYNKQTGQMEKSSVENAGDFVNWKYNTLTFHGETFENIVYTLERYYNMRIVFESESLKKYRFTGTPGNTSLESILHIFSLTSPLSYEVRDSIIILRENKEQKAYYEKALK